MLESVTEWKDLAVEMPCGMALSKSVLDLTVWIGLAYVRVRADGDAGKILSRAGMADHGETMACPAKAMI